MSKDDPSTNKADERLTVVLTMLAEMEETVELLPDTHRARGRAAVARIRRELEPVLFVLGWRN